MRPISARTSGLYVGLGSLLCVGLLAAAAWATDQPLVFPSLGPTAFLFFATPLAATASPRNTVGGHSIGCLAGYLSLLTFGLTDAPSALSTEVTGARVGAAALAMGLTGAVMAWTGLHHPPAGATTLIVALGILPEPEDLALMMLAVVMATAVAFVVNRLAGVPYPRWAPHPAAPA